MYIQWNWITKSFIIKRTKRHSCCCTSNTGNKLQSHSDCPLSSVNHISLPPRLSTTSQIHATTQKPPALSQTHRTSERGATRNVYLYIVYAGDCNDVCVCVALDSLTTGRWWCGRDLRDDIARSALCESFKMLPGPPQRVHRQCLIGLPIRSLRYS